jgi:hypothetical protein
MRSNGNEEKGRIERLRYQRSQREVVGGLEPRCYSAKEKSTHEVQNESSAFMRTRYQ